MGVRGIGVYGGMGVRGVAVGVCGGRRYLASPRGIP